PYDPYASQCSGDYETTTDQTYLGHIRMELQNVTAAIATLTRVIAERVPLTEPVAVAEQDNDDEAVQSLEIAPELDTLDEPDLEPASDYGPPGSGAVITEYPF